MVVVEVAVVVVVVGLVVVVCQQSPYQYTQSIVSVVVVMRGYVR